ncbi:MAG: GNAT family N-acetyltransferase [Phycisphaeraceae bacterium]|nr:GNAT family N-acetyltransferase [Phycisphaeraceae bacterium]
MNQQDWITPVTLENDHVRLEPLEVAHAGALCEAAVALETFRYFSDIPRTWDEAGFVRFIEHLLGPAQTVPFCVVDRASGARIGITTYLAIMPGNRSAEIGWTWIAPPFRGTVVNPSMKRLMLAHAFDDLGAIRMQLRTDERNAHSRAAILKLGARFEGIHRQDKITHNGFRRSSAFFSILEDEWPAVREGLDRRISAFAAG